MNVFMHFIPHMFMHEHMINFEGTWILTSWPSKVLYQLYNLSLSQI